MQPQVSISTAFSYDILIGDQIAIAAEVGFSHISLGLRREHSGYLDPIRRQQLKDSLQQHGIKIDTIHAQRLNKPDAISEATATVEAAADLGAKCIVAHGGPPYFDSEGFDKRFRKLLDICYTLTPIAQHNGVVFALENINPGPATDLVRRVLPELDSSIFGLCYDSAHDQIDSPRQFNIIEEFQDRLFAVHLSDRINPFIDHVIPGEGFIDWLVMCDKLRMAHYKKPILMEVMMKHSQFKESKTYLREAYQAGVGIWQLIHK
ncbi:sugar phosphate isomerase/epimerase family protein [Chloroflexota bacterium]